jgi:hypothetical protein
LIEPFFWARIKLLHALRMSPFDIAVFAVPCGRPNSALCGSRPFDRHERIKKAPTMFARINIIQALNPPPCSRVQSRPQTASLGKTQASERPMTVFVYVNTSKQVGDADHIKVFANQDAAETEQRTSHLGCNTKDQFHRVSLVARGGQLSGSKERSRRSSGQKVLDRVSDLEG